MKHIYILLLVLIAKPIWSQSNNPIFQGGNSDGWANNSVAETNNNIYAGGNNDGWATGLFSELRNEIYAGGNADGWSSQWSDVFHLDVLAITENTFGNLFAAYPNPSSGIINVDLGNIYQFVTVDISNAAGQQIMSANYTSTDILALKIEGANGIYFVKITGNDKTVILKILKN